jgi:hypothetical protein
MEYVWNSRVLHFYQFILQKGAPVQSIESFVAPNQFDLYAIGAQECEQSLQKSILISSKGAKWMVSIFKFT